MTSKQQLREQARARRAELARALPDFAARIAAFADELSFPLGANIAGTWPIRDEADPSALMTALAAKGHSLALPCIIAREEPLQFRKWSERDATIVNLFGIAEPLEDAEVVAPQVVLVPMLAFDADGYRLGYGGGYYDRTLASLREAGMVLAVGIAYAGQEVPRLPRKPHDEKLDLILTEKGVRRFTP